MLNPLDTENADRDIYDDGITPVTVLTHTPDATHARWCQALVYLGDATNPLDGSGGQFQLYVAVAGRSVQPCPQVVTFGPEVQSAIWSSPFPVPPGAEVVVKILSPNSADISVDITATLYDCMPVAVDASGRIDLVDAPNATAVTAITAAVWSAATSGLTTAGSIGKKLADWVLGTDQKVLLSTDAQTGVTIPTVTALTVKTDFALSAASVGAIWAALTSGLTTAGSIGKKLADWVLGTDQKVLLSTDAQTGVTIPTVTAVTGRVTANVDQINGQAGNVTSLVLASAIRGHKATYHIVDATTATITVRNAANSADLYVITLDTSTGDEVRTIAAAGA